MALLLAIFMAFWLTVGGIVVAGILALTLASRPHALRWLSLLAGTGLGGAAATFGLVYLWEKILNLGGVSEDAFFTMLILPALIIFFAQVYLFYGREEKKNSGDEKEIHSDERNSPEIQNQQV